MSAPAGRAASSSPTSPPSWWYRSRSRSCSGSRSGPSAPEAHPLPEKAATPAMEMPGWLDWLGGVVERRAGLWQRLGDLESRVYREELDAVRLAEPVYVT